MKNQLRLFILLMALVSYFQIEAQSDILNFNQLLNEGFQNNFDIKLNKFSLSKADYTLLKASGGLNANIITDLTYGEGVNPGLDNDGTQILQSKLVIPTKFGVDFYSGFLAERTINYGSTNTPFNTSGAFAGLRVPLLRGFGKSSLLNTDIELSKINKEVREKEFSNEILTFIRNILNNYLTLKQVVQEYHIMKNLVDDSKIRREQIKTLVENDLIPFSENTRANSNFISINQNLKISKIQVSQVYFETKNLIGVDNSRSDSIPILMDLFPNPDKQIIYSFITEKESNLDSLIKNSPQYKSIALGVDENQILLKNAQNQKRNPLNLDVRVSNFGSYENGDFNLRNTFNSTPGTSLLVTLTHLFPIKNQQQKGAYLEQLTEYDVSKTNLNQYLYESKINAEINISLLKQKLVIFDDVQSLVSISEKVWTDEIEKYKLGNSTLTDIIIARNVHYNAKKSFVQLKYDILKTYINIKYILGELPKNEEELNDFTLTTLLN